MTLSDSKTYQAVVNKTDLTLMAVCEEHGSLEIPDDAVAIKVTGEWLSRRPGTIHQYPALMGRWCVLGYREIMKLVPQNAVVVEVGSYCGGSAKIALEIIPSNTVYHCIDNGFKFGDTVSMDEPMHDDLHIAHGVRDWPSRLDFVRHYLRAYPNVVFWPASSPEDMQHWDTPIDVYFEDSRHANPTLRANLDFWVPHVKRGGIISGHDYSPDYPDVIAEVHALADTLETTFTVFPGSAIWWMTKP